MDEHEPVTARQVRPRLELPEADFLALKAYTVRQRTTLARLIEAAIVAWLDRDEEAPPASAPLGERVVRYTVALPEELHVRLKVRAVYARTTMQALMRAALAPAITAAHQVEASDHPTRRPGP